MTAPERDNRSRRDPSSIDCSVLSLEEESSFHMSDYSISSRDEFSPGSSNNKRKHASSHGKFRVINNTAQPTLTPQQVAGNSTTISSTGSSSFSSGSPWFDDSDSSSSASSSQDLRRLPTLWKREDPVQVSETPPRRVSQKHSLKKVPMRRSNSASSVGTGMDPSKPIDLTSAPDVGIIPKSLLEYARLSRISKESTDSILNDKARIVGIVAQLQGVKSKDFRSSTACRKQPYGIARPVPPVLIPEFCTSPDDDMSSLEANISDSKVLPLHLRHGSKNNSSKSQQRLNVRTADLDAESSIGWIEQRTNLELCLIFSVATSLIVLSILLAFMLKG